MHAMGRASCLSMYARLLCTRAGQGPGLAGWCGCNSYQHLILTWFLGPLICVCSIHEPSERLDEPDPRRDSQKVLKAIDIISSTVPRLELLEFG
jgi:hypothetical protein